MAYPLDSPADNNRKIKACPNSVAMLADGHLHALMEGLTPDPTFASPIIAESLFRCWLHGSSTLPHLVLSENSLCIEFLYLVNSTKKHSEKPFTDIETSESSLIHNYLKHRWDAFQECDGIIPVVSGSTKEALPIPFRLNWGDNDSPVYDQAGREIPQWFNKIKILSGIFEENISLELLCTTGDFSGHLKGGSLGLAVSCAYLKKKNMVPDYLPLNLLATGVFKENKLHLTDGIEAKQLLADKIGARFLFPAENDPLYQMGIGDSADTIKTKLNDLILDSGIAIKPSPKKALDRIKKLKQQIHQQQRHKDKMDFQHAERVIDRLESIFNNNYTSRFSKEGLSLCFHLRAQILNHQGKPREAEKHIKQIGDSSLSSNTDADRIVSLSDQGKLNKAISLGLESIEKVERDNICNSEEKTRLLMHLNGAFGQALRAKALCSPLSSGNRKAVESLKHLKVARTLAEELEEPAEICRDQAQILLWYALIAPSQAEPIFQKTIKILHQYPKSVYKVSEYFAIRARWLAAYRQYLLDPTVPSDTSLWSLPDCQHDPAFSWVYATSQKYRGTLLAAQGELEDVLDAFKEAITPMEQEIPLLKFIGATAAVQAGISLEDPIYLEKAQKVFEAASNKLQDLGSEQWNKWCKCLLEKRNPTIPNQQLYFPY